VFVVVALALLQSRQVNAHSAPFSYLDLKIDDSGVAGTLVVHDFDAAHDLGVADPTQLHDSAVAVRYRDILTRLMASRLVVVADGQRREIEWTSFETLRERQSLQLGLRVAGPTPSILRIEALLFPYDPVHQTFINVYEGTTLTHQTILSAGRPTVDYYAGTVQGAVAVIRTFVPTGIEHILIGPDHVLFLIGLLLLGGSLRKLAGIVTAFTIGHSITLSLAALDIVSPPARLVEPAIALSIVFVGADNLLVRNQSAPRDIRALVAAVFGLVHGFGFAAVLKEFGLPASALGWSHGYPPSERAARRALGACRIGNRNHRRRLLVRRTGFSVGGHVLVVAQSLDIEGVCEYIDRHCAEPLTIDQLASLAGVSTFHFIRAFRAATGVTPHQYVRQRRLERAGELLATTSLPVTEICDRVGFQSLGSFSSVFKKVTGEAPSEFRAKRRKHAYIPTCFIRMYRAD
jgi:AraC-like DNA-binding protein